MERTNKIMAIARCPQCDAACVDGHDEDCQIYCAKCGYSFVPKSFVRMTDAEYKEFTQKAKRRFDKGGWTAYTTD